MTGERVIAIVEDDADFREALEEILAHAGYRPVGYSGAREALAGLRALRVLPSLLLLDLMMPGMSGWEFRDEQVRDPGLRDLPVIVLTASTSLDRNPIAVNGILRKPVDIDALLDAVALYAS